MSITDVLGVLVQPGASQAASRVCVTDRAPRENWPGCSSFGRPAVSEHVRDSSARPESCGEEPRGRQPLRPPGTGFPLAERQPVSFIRSSTEGNQRLGRAGGSPGRREQLMIDDNTIHLDKFLPHPPAAVWQGADRPGVARPLVGGRRRQARRRTPLRPGHGPVGQPALRGDRRGGRAAAGLPLRRRLARASPSPGAWSQRAPAPACSSPTPTSTSTPPWAARLFEGMCDGWPKVLDHLGTVLTETA